MRLLRHPLVKWVFLAASIIAGAVALVSYWPQVTGALAELPGRNVAVAAVATLAYVFATMLCWRSAVRDLGAELSLPDGARLFFVSQIGKYIPGGVWNVLAVSEMGRAYSVPRTAGVGGMLIFWLVSVTTGLFAGGLYVMASPVSVPGGPVWIVAGLVLGAVLLSPPVLRRVLALGLRLIGRRRLEREPTARGLLEAVFWALVGWLAAGTQVWMIAEPMSADGLSLVATISAYALAWTAGFLFVIAPAGAGVRELVLGALLVASLSAGAVVTLVLLSRFLITAADFLLAGLSVLAKPSHVDSSQHPIR